MKDEYDFSQSIPNPYIKSGQSIAIAKAEINRLLKATLQKNEPTIEATDEWWEQQREQLIKKYNILDRS
jgi:hypothetical protein